MMQYRILGLLLIYFFAITIKQDYEEFVVRSKGKLVSVIIQGKHKGGGRFNNYFIEFEFDSKNFDVKVSKDDYLNKSIGDNVDLLHVRGIDHFVLPGLAIGIDPFIGLAFFVAGVFFIFFPPKTKGNNSKR